MKKTLVAISLITLMITACEKEEAVKSGGVQNNPNTQKSCVPCDEFRQYFKENVSFFDERIRSVNPKQYVKEILIIDLGNSGKMSERYLYQGLWYIDNGQGNDKVSGDGTYTSINVYNHSTDIAYDPDKEVRSIKSNPLINPEFKRRAELAIFAGANEIRGVGPGDPGPPEPLPFPFYCHYKSDNSSGFPGDGDKDTVDALNATGNLNCYFLYA